MISLVTLTCITVEILADIMSLDSLTDIISLDTLADIVSLAPPVWRILGIKAKHGFCFFPQYEWGHARSSGAWEYFREYGVKISSSLPTLTLP